MTKREVVAEVLSKLIKYSIEREGVESVSLIEILEIARDYGIVNAEELQNEG